MRQKKDPVRPLIDPFALARGEARRRFPRRFYQQASVGEAGLGHCLLLDGKQAHTPQHRPLCVALRPLAEMIAAEWAAQHTHLDPSTMPITKIVQTGLDGVEAERAAVEAEIVRYAGSDLLCYRAPGPASLVRAQAEAWDPVLDWAQSSLRAHFIVAEGISYVPQPQAALDRVQETVAALSDCVALAAVATMTTLCGSALLALAVVGGRLSAAEAWARAHVDEVFQESQWGVDAEAQDRRAHRLVEMEAAGRIIALFELNRAAGPRSARLSARLIGLERG